VRYLPICLLFVSFAYSQTVDSRKTDPPSGPSQKHLRALREPRLEGLASDSSNHVYRFTWLRTFHHPLAVRIVIAPNGNGAAFIKETSGQGGYEPGKLVRNRQIRLNRDAVDALLESFEKAKFWREPTEKGPVDEIVLDGAYWIFEGVRGGKYHRVMRWSPDCERDKEFFALGKFFAFAVASLKIDYSEVY
jgi:hypothetical protein